MGLAHSSVKRSRLQFGFARITSAIWGSVNLILIVGFIVHLKRDQGWSRITLVGRFAPCAGFVTLRQTFVRRSQNCGMVPRETTGASQAASGFARSGKPITSALEPWSKVSSALT